MVLATCAFNLQKYLKFKLVDVISRAIAVQKVRESAFIRYSFALTKLLLNLVSTIRAKISLNNEISAVEKVVVQQPRAFFETIS